MMSPRNVLVLQDFGLSGFRQGMLWSRHDRIQLAIEPICYLGAVSSQTQMTMAKVLADYGEFGWYTGAFQKRLRVLKSKSS